MSASCSFRTFSSVTCLLQSQNTFYFQWLSKENRLAEIITLLVSINRWRKILWKNAHMHRHTHQNICTLCQFLQLCFCRLCKKFNPDSSYQPFSFQVSGNAVFLRVCLFGSGRECVCMHACMHVRQLMKYLAVPMHNAVICLHAQYCLQKKLFCALITYNILNYEELLTSLYIGDPASQVQH